MSFEVIDPVQHASALAAITPVGSVWRHRSGHEYRVCGHCTLEATVEAAVLYRRVEDNGPTWARAGHEFCDGRFSRIDDSDALQPAPMSVAEAARVLGDKIFSDDWTDGQSASGVDVEAHDTALKISSRFVSRETVLAIVQHFLCALASPEGE